MASLFNKKAKRGSIRNLSSRLADDEQDAGDVSFSSSTGSLPGSPAASSDAVRDVEDSPASAIAAARAKNKVKKKKSDARLSFGGDEDESSPSTFVPKKSALSRALHVPPPPMPYSASDDPLDDPSAPSSSASTYSKAYLSQLKASNPATPAVVRMAAADGDVGDVADEMDGTGWSRAAREKYGSLVLEEHVPSIPSSSEINAAKARRTKARQNPSYAQGPDEFISLDASRGTVKIRDEYDVDMAGPHPESRLMREEDETGDGDDEHAELTGANERIPLGKKANRDAARRLKSDIGQLIDEAEGDEGSDDEAKEWEEAQIRRASKWEEQKVDDVKKPYRAAPIPQSIALPSLSFVSARLNSALSALSIATGSAEAQLETNAAELAALDRQEGDLRKEVARVESKREWAVEFRGWVEELARFLEVKFPLMEAIEKDNVFAVSSRSDLVRRRRLEDLSDDLALCLGVLTPPESSSALEVDELGREIPSPDAASSLPALSNVRTSRRAAKDARLGNLNPDDSDSSLSPSDESDYQSALSTLSTARQSLLSDVLSPDFHSPFSSPLGLAARFAKWRSLHAEEYDGAFGGLAMVQAWEFWARCELIGWQPLEKSSAGDGVEGFESVVALRKYARSSQGQQEGESMEDDREESKEEKDLVEALVRTAVAPRLSALLSAGAYDPYSLAKTRRVVDLMEQLEDPLGGKTSSRYQTLVVSFLAPLTMHLDPLEALVSSCLIGSPPPPIHPLSIPSLVHALSRLLLLIRCLCLLRPALPPTSTWPTLVDRVLEVGRIVGEHGGNWDAPGGGKEWSSRALQLLGKGAISVDRERRMRSGPPRAW